VVRTTESCWADGLGPFRVGLVLVHPYELDNPLGVIRSLLLVFNGFILMWSHLIPNCQSFH